MAADFYQAYEGEPATQFIRNVPVGKWDETRVPVAEIGAYLVTARRQGQNWFVGAITNEEAREIEFRLDFLNPNTQYHAVIYADGDGADYQHNPYPVKITQSLVSSSEILTLKLARGGGAAIEFYPQGTEFTAPAGNAGEVDPGRTYQLRAKHSGRLLSVGDSEVIQYEDDSTLTQRWTLSPLGNGLYRVAAGDQVLTAEGTENDAPVTLKADTGQPMQKWKLDHIVGSWYRLVNSASGRVLDVAGVSYANDAKLHLWEWAHGSNQVWSLEPVTQ